MKYLNKLQLRRTLVLCVIALSITFSSYAQEDEYEDPGGGGEGDPDGTEENVPIDGGLSVLLAAGAAYIGKKAYDKKKGKEVEP